MSRQYLIYLPIEFHAVLAHLKPYLVMTLCPENAVPLQPRPAFNGPPRPISTLNEVYYNLTTARTGGRATCGRIKYIHIANATWWGTLSGDTCVSSPISPTTASLAPHADRGLRTQFRRLIWTTFCQPA